MLCYFVISTHVSRTLAQWYMSNVVNCIRSSQWCLHWNLFYVVECRRVEINGFLFFKMLVFVLGMGISCLGHLLIEELQDVPPRVLRYAAILSDPRYRSQ